VIPEERPAATSPVRWLESGDSVVTLVLDDPGRRVNTMNTGFAEALIGAIERLDRERDRIAGVIVRSAKKSFLAGGDLNRLLAVAPSDREAFVSDLNRRKSFFRRLECFPKPVLGGGLEFALCCHRRIGVDNGRTTVGLPEVRLGLLPGAGGVVRSVRRLGLDAALDEVLLSGRSLDLAEAVRLGLLDESAPSAEAAEAQARRWIALSPQSLPRTPERAPGLRIPHRRSFDRAQNAHAILAEVAERSLELGIDEALEAESDAFASLVVDPGVKNRIRTIFFETTALRRRVAALGEAAGRPVIVAGTPEARQRLREWEPVVTVLDSGRDCPMGALMVGAAGPAPRAWTVDDQVGDGQRVLEAQAAEEAGNTLAALAGAGVIVKGVVDAAMTDAAADASAGQVASAAYWAGLRGGRPSAAGSAVDSDLVCALLDRIAKDVFGIASEFLQNPDDADIASVRAGGFPAWTGGVRPWLRKGRALVSEMVELRAEREVL